ncbi:uncharacterized protein HD556DRAFT_1419076 [Suillus plorans]|uniref:Secreted protein n=1 Tax=Suillus plorans TaxID=116603 RepID=A0A9P7ABG5_9AGAM|nr:uncharacterized protein HD556DRAFT_1419076 [Suillus plorans]KAG1785841.1 hypothetical protein HD556DRAFT_1419076 [Suillus plorans]
MGALRHRLLLKVAMWLAMIVPSTRRCGHDYRKSQLPCRSSRKSLNGMNAGRTNFNPGANSTARTVPLASTNTALSTHLEEPHETA